MIKQNITVKSLSIVSDRSLQKDILRPDWSSLIRVYTFAIQSAFCRYINALKNQIVQSFLTVVVIIVRITVLGNFMV